MTKTDKLKAYKDDKFIDFAREREERAQRKKLVIQFTIYRFIYNFPSITKVNNEKYNKILVKKRIQKRINK